MKRLELYITEEDRRTLEAAAKVAYNKEKHRKNYGIGSFLKESALNRAKRILKK